MIENTLLLLVSSALASLASIGCESPEQGAAASPSQAGPTFTVKSPAFAPMDPIPTQYTADGKDTSPPLNWEGLPTATRELAIIVDDPDAPSAKPWVHWVIYKISADVRSLPAGIAPRPTLDQPSGTMQGKNSWGRIGYGGPDPPRGKVHHYHFCVYALDATLNVQPGMDKQAVLSAMAGHILAQGELVGTYQR